jgi:hypothetical protein
MLSLCIHLEKKKKCFQKTMDELQKVHVMWDFVGFSTNYRVKKD